MPGKWTHYYFARDVAQDYDLEFKEDREFYLGALGPDFLTFIPDDIEEEVFKMFREDSTREILCFVFDYIDREELRAYLHGFLAHYALDSRSGFFVNSLQNEGYDRLSVTMALDDAILRRRSPKLLGRPNLYSYISLGKTIPDKLAGFYRAVAKEIFSYELDGEAINQAYRKFLRILKQGNSSLGLLQIGGSWYDRPPEQLLASTEEEKIYLEFLPTYEEARLFYKKLLEDESPCANRNFRGEFL